MRILFFGTPSFAVPSLKGLLQSSHEVVGVVTQPDRPRGRGREPSSSPIKEMTLARGIPLFQPEELKESRFLKKIREFQAECAVVVAYGKIFPKKLFTLFPQGAINLHASLLPRYRGAAPIQWALINGEKETGVTIFQIDEFLDHGPILLQARHPIQPEESAVSLNETLAELGSESLLKSLKLLEGGMAHPTPQEEAAATVAPRLKKQDGFIDWNAGCLEIHNRIRGVQPWPGAMTWMGGQMLKIFSTRAEPTRSDSWCAAGSVVVAHPSEGLWVQTGAGQLRIDRLQLEGGQLLDTPAFLRGHPVPVGTRLTHVPSRVVAG